MTAAGTRTTPGRLAETTGNTGAARDGDRGLPDRYAAKSTGSCKCAKKEAKPGATAFSLGASLRQPAGLHNCYVC
jgi:hypothetical protein